MGILHENQCTFVTLSVSVLLRMRNISEKSCRENQNTHFMFSIYFFCPKNCAACEIMGKNMVEPDMPQMTVWCMRIASWIH